MSEWLDRTHVVLSTSSDTRGNITSFALLSIGIATMLAVGNVPDDVEPPGALFISGLFLTIGVLLPVAVQLRRDLSSVLRVENGIMIGVVYWLLMDLLQSAYPFQFVTADNVRSAFVNTGGFAMAVWIGAFGRGWRLPGIVVTTATRELGMTLLYSATVLAFVLGMSKFAIPSGFNPGVMIDGLLAARWDAPWGRGDLGGADAFLDHLQYFGYILPSLCVLMAVRVGWLDWRVIIGLVLSAVMGAFLAQSGGRRIIGVMVGAALFSWVASNPRLSSRIFFGGVGTVGAVLVFMQEMLRYRNVGFSAWLSGEVPEMAVEHLHVDDNFLRLSQLINFYPDHVDWIYLQAIFHALTLPVPRFFWPGKPEGPGFDLPALLGMNGLSLSCSIIGELYVSYGLAAVLVGGGLLGRIAGMWNKILMLPGGASRPLMYGLGLMAMFAGMRSLQALVQMSYIVLAWIAITAMLAKSGTGAAAR